MPELPEVETVARQLAPLLRGRRVRGLRILDPLLGREPTPRLAGRVIGHVERSGKQVLIEFERGHGGLHGGRPSEPGGDSRKARSLFLAVHLRMTGRLIWTDDPATDDPAHLRARFTLDRGRLLFRDTRRFGTFRWYASREAAAPAGRDPLDPALDTLGVARLLDGTRQNVKAFLLRQDRLVGLGNIYASEILHAARVAPTRGTDTLERGEIVRLHREMRRILGRAIEACGTTFSDFQDARGVEGSYQRFLRVYEREGRPCRRCRAPIERLVQQQRSTYWCAGCQR